MAETIKVVFRKSTNVRFIVCLLLTAMVSFVPGPAGGSPAAAPQGSQEATAREEALLALSPEARRWARRQTRARGPAVDRLRGLAAALVLPGGLDFQEERRTRTATETFEARRGNCVSIAFLFVAMARELEIDAYFVLSETVEARHRRGDLQVDDLHLAAAHGPPDRFTVFDLAGERAGTASFHAISDRAGAAVFYSNRGAELLLEKQLEGALEQLRTAVELAPDLHLAWTNLGVVHRRLGDTWGAEAAFRRAIRLAPHSVTAWRNLALLLSAAEPQRKQTGHSRAQQDRHSSERGAGG